jgi:diguanylate cyclase (GGDEF)-like protein/PAS domain S-box-containing protein
LPASIFHPLFNTSNFRISLVNPKSQSALKEVERSAGSGATPGLPERVRRQQEALLEIMRSGLLADGLAAVIARLTEVAARTLGAQRASVWMFDDSHTALELSDMYESVVSVHAQSGRLDANRYPAYFDAFRSQRVVSAIDARRDPRTREFRDDYLLPLGIVSMLDAAIWQQGVLRGVVCIESVGVRREWTPDEEQFAASIADLVALASENAQRRNKQSLLAASEQRFAQVFRLSQDWMVVTRLSDGLVLEVNESFLEGSGYRRDEFVGHTTLERGLWAVPGQREKWLAQCRADRRVRGMVGELRISSGELRTCQISSEHVIVNGEECMISIARDITEIKRQERLVFEIAQGLAAATGEFFFRSLAERMQQALDGDLAFVGEIDPSDRGRIRTVAVQRRSGPGEGFSYLLSGSPCETVVGQRVCSYPSGVAQLFPSDPALAEHGIEAYVGAPLLNSKNEPMGLIAVLFRDPLKHAELSVNLLRIFATRASAELERQQQHAELEFRASHDMLTGLTNRTTLEERINADISASVPGMFSALLMVDLDRFKEINDTLGHAVGDSLLVQIARRLDAENRRSEICMGEVARLGGDEFGIWLHDIDAAHIADLIASRTLSAITAPFELQDFRFEVGASIGIAMYPGHGGDASELMRCADIAMYVAKRAGSGYARYEASTDTYSPKRLTLIAELGAAVRNGQLRLQFQPRVDLQKGVVCGFEALVRWRHPRLGVIPPSEFIPLAEVTDAIRPLTLWVLDQSLAQLLRWNQAGRAVSVAVNLSARQLSDDACSHQVRRLLEKHRVDPTLLELEITESALISDPERATLTLQQIHDMGVKLSIDDFGTGYSSLSHLRRLPLHALKIDVSFVTQMLASEQDAVIVESTIGLAHNLGLSVVAEGIEDAKTRDRLRELGCDEGQGYFFSKPIDADVADRWLDESGY